MKKTISVKELRMNFPVVREELKKGTSFTLIYRSEPIADICPLNYVGGKIDGKFGKKDIGGSVLPDSIEDFLQNIDKYAFRGKKKFDAVKEIRKQRGYEE